MQTPNPPDSFLITTSRIALKAKTILAELGYKTGVNMNLAKFGEDPAYFNSGMICVKQPHEQMGALAARILLDETPSADHVLNTELLIPGR